ncbi:MAG: FKBP-type peptidyl-prolyl cis-trans isomerase [Verrucomicrobiota bacterium]
MKISLVAFFFAGILFSSNLFAQNEATKNLMAGRDFLEENVKRKEVKVTSSGLQYEVLNRGEGTKSPRKSDRVAINYRGTLLDGTTFDRTTLGRPAIIKLSGVIKGWKEALTRMVEGDKWKIYVPHKLGYGGLGSPPRIGPNATLVFEIELLKINP